MWGIIENTSCSVINFNRLYTIFFLNGNFIFNDNL